MVKRTAGLLLNRLIFVLALIGVFISLYLAITYASDRPIRCAGDSGCDVVRASPYANLLGVPVPWYGVVGYTLLGLHAYVRAFHLPGWALKGVTLGIFLGAAAGLVFTGYLNAVEFFILQAFCLWCTASSVTIVGIFLTSLVEVRLTFFSRREVG